MLRFKQFIIESAQYQQLKNDAKKLDLPSFLNKYSVEGQHITNQKHMAPHHHFEISHLDPSEHDSWENPDLSPRMLDTVNKLRSRIATDKSSIEPVLVQGMPDDKKFRPQVLDGHHRTIAAYREGLKTVPGWFDNGTLKQIHKQANK
jgi:hypothetical protein